MPLFVHRGLHDACTQTSHLHETIRSTDRLLQVTWVPFRPLPSTTVTVSCERNLAFRVLLGFPMALTSVAVKSPLGIVSIRELGRNEMGSVFGIWFPAIHWRAKSSSTLQVKITVSPGQAACLPSCCTLEVRVTWAIDAGSIAAYVWDRKYRECYN